MDNAPYHSDTIHWQAKSPPVMLGL
jgi:hypothetical protein